MCAQYTLVHTCMNTHKAFQAHSMNRYPQTMVLCFAEVLGEQTQALMLTQQNLYLLGQSSGEQSNLTLILCSWDWFWCKFKSPFTRPFRRDQARCRQVQSRFPTLEMTLTFNWWGHAKNQWPSNWAVGVKDWLCLNSALKQSWWVNLTRI